MINEQIQTIRLLLAGLCGAEACGSSSEFVAQSQIPALYAKLKPKGWPWKQCGGGAFGWAIGAATDDGMQSLALCESFLKRGRFDPEDVAQRLVAWYQSGPPDVGGTTARTLGRIASGTPWHEAGLLDYKAYPHNAANGSLMRNGVLSGIMHGQDLNLLFRATVQHSMMTHGGSEPTLNCACQSWIIADLLSGWEQGPTADPDGWLESFFSDWTEYVSGEDDEYVGKWLDSVRNSMQQAGDALTEADWNPLSFNPFKTNFAGRLGYCLLTLQIGVWALRWSFMNEPFPVPAGFPAEVFERRGPWCIAWPALVGFDSDTYGAVAGPMIAAAHTEVPESMTKGLEALEAFDKLGAGKAGQ